MKENNPEWEREFDATCGVGMPDGVRAEVKSFFRSQLKEAYKKGFIAGGMEEINKINNELGLTKKLGDGTNI